MCELIYSYQQITLSLILSKSKWCLHCYFLISTKIYIFKACSEFPRLQRESNNGPPVIHCTLAEVQYIVYSVFSKIVSKFLGWSSETRERFSEPEAQKAPIYFNLHVYPLGLKLSESLEGQCTGIIKSHF